MIPESDTSLALGHLLVTAGQPRLTSYGSRPFPKRVKTVWPRRARRFTKEVWSRPPIGTFGPIIR